MPASFFSFSELLDGYTAAPPEPRHIAAGLPGRWKVPDETVIEYHAALSESQLAKLEDLVMLAAANEGVGKLHRYGVTWQRLERRVLDDLIAGEVDLDTLEIDVAQ